ncbi:MAG: hypothetical protein IIB32_07765 [Chloroflexi bacterium]|nr:hypothetical protein [Chloroflexota bacterium]
MKRPKFHPMDLVKVRTPGRHETLGSRPPGTLIMGKTAIVEIAGLINGAASATGDSMTPAYYIRIGELPPVLIYEEWLEEA